MTTADRPSAAESLGHNAADVHSTVMSLREAVFGPHEELNAWVRNILVSLCEVPRSESATEKLPDLLRAAIAGLGRPVHEIAADPLLRGALCDWAHVTVPRLLPVLTEHVHSAVSAILALGDGSRYQQDCLGELDTGEALGELMFIEPGNADGADQQAIAAWDGSAGFWLSTPEVTYYRFMPHGAEFTAAKTVVIPAHLYVDGRDEGVFLFLMKLRTADGRLIKGAEIVRGPEQGYALMDHALVWFDRVWLPREALLGGDWAWMNAAGQFECNLEPHRRYHHATSMMGNGRLDLANAAISSARAGLVELVNHTRQQKPYGVPLAAVVDVMEGAGQVDIAQEMAAVVDVMQGVVQLDIAREMAAVYATSVLGRCIRDMRAAPTGDEQMHELWSRLAKPLLSNTAYKTLGICRARIGDQGGLRVNRIADWAGSVEAIITAEYRTAECDNETMQIKAGKARIDTALQLPETPTEMPWYIEMLATRENTITNELRDGTYKSGGTALDEDTAAIELAAAAGVRLAATALFAAATTTKEPTAKELLTSLAADYSLECISTNALWYLMRHLMPADLAAKVSDELLYHRKRLIPHLQELADAFAMPEYP
ncbi:hypothetical protein AB0C34_18000 [Nocardia sp. NPDC049220]|uniref:hypothetical protein n=1 Tax=Nocardia sp. NPDC049220 TaxID=3155273 RepID=UPI0033F2DBFF